MWSLRAKILVVTVAVVLPLMAVNTILSVRMSQAALEEDTRNGGLALARELALSAASAPGAGRKGSLGREISALLGSGSLVRDAAVYAAGPEGLVLRASEGKPRALGPEEEAAARGEHEVAVVTTEDQRRILRVVVPVREKERSVGVVSLGLLLTRVDAVARRTARQAIALDAVTVFLIVGSVAGFLNRALTRPVWRLVQVMRRAEGGDLAARAPEARQDEVGQIGQGLNRMLERVSSFQSELARQVAEATAELRAVNERLYAAQQQVARNERLAAAGELAAAMAHDVGTPLTAMSGHLQLLEEEVVDRPVKERLRMIIGQVDRAIGAAQRLLDVARPQPARSPVDLNALLVDLLVLTSPEAQRKGITVSRSLAEGLTSVLADPDQMQELFLNLITNALDAMGQGGVLTVETEVWPLGGSAPGVRVTVGDTGPGMAPAVLARVFEPFYTTKALQGGTGLGLAICRRIAKDHGGSVHLESRSGRGTRAVVELPVEAG